MALILKDRVRETTAVVSTGAATLLGAVTDYQAFTVIGNGNTTWYAIVGQGTGEWEVGVGTYTLSGTSLSRDTVLASSNANNLVNFSAGTKDVFVTWPAEKPALQLDQTVPQTLTGGRPISNEGMQFGLTPAVPIATEGQLTWSSDYHTMTLRSLPETNLRVGQDDWRYVYNNTASEIPIGSAVYVTGVGGSGLQIVTVALAKADAISTLDIIGIAAMDIYAGQYGMVSIRGNLFKLNTSSILGASIGAVCYLSAATAGKVTTVIPALPNLEVVVGRIITMSTTATVTISGPATPAVIGWASHGLAIGDRVTFTSSVALPAGIVALQHYYVMTAGYGASAFQIELSVGSGTAINTSDAGSGTFTGYKFDGTFNVHVDPAMSLNQLTDVTIGTPVLDQVIRYNGTEWINSTASVAGAGPGIAFYNASPSIIAAGTQNTIQLLTLSKTPIVTAEQTKSGTGDGASTPIPYSAWLYNSALGRTVIDGGTWNFQTWANVDSTGGTTTIARGVYAVLDEPVGTVKVTTIGGDTTTLRTATATDGTPFAAAKINVGGTPLTDSYLKTTKGLLRIVSQTSDTVVHVATPSTYTDDAVGMAFSVWKLVINSGQSSDINTTTGSGNYQLMEVSVAGASYAITVLHKLGIISFVTSTSSRTITTTYDGITRNTHVDTPLITLHNNLAGLQGGVANEYYHLTSADYVGTGTGLVVRSVGPTLSAPVLGTPASGIVTNLTGTASININGTVGATTPAAGTFTSINGGPLAGFKNYIINGNMDIAQRGTAAVTTSSLFGPADRFVTSSATNTFSTTLPAFVSGDTLYDTGGATNYTEIAVTSVAGAGNNTILFQSIENVRVLAGKTVTVSFWAKAATGTPLIGIEIAQTFGSGGSPSAAATGIGQNLTLSATWTKYIKTFTVASINGKTLGTDVNSSSTQLIFWLDAGATFNTRSGTIGQASKTVSIGQVQLEEGSVATPFEYRPIGTELALCQRYYYRKAVGEVNASFGSGNMHTTTNYRGVFIFATPMRSIPEISYDTITNFAVQTNAGNFTASAMSKIGSSTNEAWISVTVATATAGVGAILVNIANTPWIAFSSEL